MEDIRKIASFEVNHDYIVPGLYISRTDGDITTFDMRTRVPNAGDYMDNLTMHSVEHMLATYLRNGPIGGAVIYFGPMGCQTGFYLLTRGIEPRSVYDELCRVLSLVISHEGEIFGKSRIECGNYKNLDITAAKRECERYLSYLTARGADFEYPKGNS